MGAPRALNRRTTRGSPPRVEACGPIGMKSVTVRATPVRISKKVVRTFVPVTYW